jgi:hypothetical protein
MNFLKPPRPIAVLIDLKRAVKSRLFFHALDQASAMRAIRLTVRGRGIYVLIAQTRMIAMAS